MKITKQYIVEFFSKEITKNNLYELTAQVMKINEDYRIKNKKTHVMDNSSIATIFYNHRNDYFNKNPDFLSDILNNISDKLIYDKLIFFNDYDIISLFLKNKISEKCFEIMNDFFVKNYSFFNANASAYYNLNRYYTLNNLIKLEEKTSFKTSSYLHYYLNSHKKESKLLYKYLNNKGVKLLNCLKENDIFNNIKYLSIGNRASNALNLINKCSMYEFRQLLKNYYLMKPVLFKILSSAPINKKIKLNDDEFENFFYTNRKIEHNMSDDYTFVKNCYSLFDKKFLGNDLLENFKDDKINYLNKVIVEVGLSLERIDLQAINLNKYSFSKVTYANIESLQLKNIVTINNSVTSHKIKKL